MKRKFDTATLKKTYRQKDFAIHIAYNESLELRLLCPEKIDSQAEKIISPIKNRNIKDIHKLLECIRQLEAADYSVAIYPDAAEYIDFLLHQNRTASLVRQIRKDPAGHPLRKTLLKSELLSYQLDGIAFAVGAGRAILAHSSTSI